MDHEYDNIMSLAKKQILKTPLAVGNNSDLIQNSERIDDTLTAFPSLLGIQKIILNDNFGQELALTRPNIKILANKKFKEITNNGLAIGSHMVQGAMPSLATAQTISEISKAAPNGLFAATAPISELMKYSNGTIGSAVMDNGQIVTHAGFKEVGSSATSTLNPATIVGAGIQAMAAISGQYYMHQISSQLSSMNKKLDKLVTFHHDEKTAMLLTTKESLKGITEKINVDAADILEIRNLHKDARNVFNEYYSRLQRMDIDDLINVKKRRINTPKALRELGDSIDNHEINLSLQICFYSDFLSCQCDLAEIAIRMKMINQVEIIKEKLEKMHFGHKEFFFINIEKEIERLYLPVINKAERIAEKDRVTGKTDIYYFAHTSDELSKIKGRKIDLKENLQVKERDLFIKMLHSFENPKEILYFPSDNPEEQRIFVCED